MTDSYMLPQLLPDDINAELLLSYYPEGKCKFAFSGLHKRNSYNDVVEMEELSDEDMLFTLSRNSIYNALPEYMFHPIDRFDNLPKSEEKELFEEEIYRQAREIENAYKFFSPFDLLLFKLRTEVRKKIEVYAKENIIMQEILGDDLTPEQKSNRFIQQLIPYLPHCRHIRGNKTFITIILRKIFLCENLHIFLKTKTHMFKDNQPQYDDSLGMELNEGFVGNQYSDTLTTYTIHYWDANECSNTLFSFLDELEQLRIFLKDYFLSVEEDLKFEISHDERPMYLGYESVPHYLNFNINI